DAFLSGRLTMAQAAAGFRSGLEAVLLGAAVNPSTRQVLELGAGVGVAAHVALSHLPRAHALLVEREPALADLARANLERNGFAARASVTCLDLGISGPERVAGGIAPDAWTSVLANPPFFDHGAGTLPEARDRAGARHMDSEALEGWVKIACGAAAPKGEVIFVHRIEALPALLTAFARRMGAITVLPLAPRPGRPAHRVLVRGIKGARAPMTLLTPLVLHGETGNGFAAEAAAI